MNTRTALNEILLSLNELPLDIDDNIEDIQIATIVDKELSIARKKILAEGWVFNRLTRNLYPNSQDNIVIPDTFLSVNGGAGITVRDWKLFNTADMTYIFEEPEVCVVIEDVFFDDLPFGVANYIVQVASLQAYINIVGNTDDVRIRTEAVRAARAEALREDAKIQGGNMLEQEYATGLLDRTGL